MNTLSIGASLLLPPLRERTELLHSLLPQGPESWDSLSNGQVGVSTISSLKHGSVMLLQKLSDET